MDAELRVLTALTTRLPRIKGAGRLAMLARRWYLRRPRVPVVACVEGVRMRLDPREYVDGWLLFGPQFYEQDERRALLHELPPNAAFLDVGAHLGLYALAAARVLGQRGTVVAIEADPETAERLRENVRSSGFDTVQVIEAGVADVEGSRRLATSPGNVAGNTFLLGSTGQDLGSLGQAVHCRPLWPLLQETGIQRIGAAKLDVEGLEHAVLRAFLRDAPKDAWPDRVLVEFHPEWVEAAGGNVLALLHAHGYRELGWWGQNHLFELSTQRRERLARGPHED